jgi:hypothetical protein
MAWFHLLLALLTLVVAGVVPPVVASEGMAASIDVVSNADNNEPSVGAVVAPESELDAFEADLDDDDIDGDRHLGLAHADHSVPLRTPHVPARASRLEPKPDPSRFAIGHGFARGPPA